MKDMGAGKLSCWEGKTDSFVQEEQRTPATIKMETGHFASLHFAEYYYIQCPHHISYG